MFRFWEDPFNQEQLLILLRQQHSLKDSCKAMDASEASLRAEWKRDPVFAEKCQLAMASAFTPVLQRIMQQAQFGDEDDPATLKAWDLAMRHCNKALDREHRHAIVDQQYDRQREIQTTGNPGLTTPDNHLVIELIDAIKEATNNDDNNNDQPELEAGARDEE